MSQNQCVHISNAKNIFFCSKCRLLLCGECVAQHLIDFSVPSNVCPLIAAHQFEKSTPIIEIVQELTQELDRILDKVTKFRDSLKSNFLESLKVYEPTKILIQSLKNQLSTLGLNNMPTHKKDDLDVPKETMDITPSQNSLNSQEVVPKIVEKPQVEEKMTPEKEHIQVPSEEKKTEETPKSEKSKTTIRTRSQRRSGGKGKSDPPTPTNLDHSQSVPIQTPEKQTQSLTQDTSVIQTPKDSTPLFQTPSSTPSSSPLIISTPSVEDLPEPKKKKEPPPKRERLERKSKSKLISFNDNRIEFEEEEIQTPKKQKKVVSPPKVTPSSNVVPFISEAKETLQSILSGLPKDYLKIFKIYKTEKFILTEFRKLKKNAKKFKLENEEEVIDLATNIFWQHLVDKLKINFKDLEIESSRYDELVSKRDVIDEISVLLTQFKNDELLSMCKEVGLLTDKKDTANLNKNGLIKTFLDHFDK